jgi:hypothetical protein
VGPVVASALSLPTPWALSGAHGEAPAELGRVVRLHCPSGCLAGFVLAPGPVPTRLLCSGSGLPRCPWGGAGGGRCGDHAAGGERGGDEELVTLGTHPYLALRNLMPR